MFNFHLDRIRLALRRVFFWRHSSTVKDELPPEILHDHRMVIGITGPKRIPHIRQIRYALRVFSPNERRVLILAILTAFIALGITGTVFVRGRVIRVPTVGGTMTEALINEPNSINPLDAPLNDVDSDLVSLIFSGLFRMEGTKPVTDLAKSYSWSNNRKILTVKLRQNAIFHDGTHVTAKDVRFTYDSLQNPDRKSPLAALFRGVTVDADDPSTVRFTLNKPDATFLSKLTVGILPAHLWQNIPEMNARLSDLNLKPVGSGPYRVKSFLRDNLGAIHSYTLERFNRYYGAKPYLSTLIFQFYPNRQSAFDAFHSDLVEAVGFVNTADAAKVSAHAHDIKLRMPEETIAFFNLNNKILKNKKIRKALSLAINREDIINALHGYADPINGPYTSDTATTTHPDLPMARNLLTHVGWKLPSNGNVRILDTSKSTTTIATPSSTEFAITISVADSPDLRAVAEALKRQWSLIGARVRINTMTTEELMRRATRSRDLQIVLLNVFLGPQQDIYSLWWSKQAVDRGMNISNLTDRTVDNDLNAAQNATSTNALSAARAKVSKAIINDIPAAFLVRPIHHYLVSDAINGVSNSISISRPSNRLRDILHWYIKTGWRWK